MSDNIGYFKTPLPEKIKPVVVYIGGFSPFHNGHFEQYQKIKKDFPNIDIYVLYQEVKPDNPRAKEFPFSQKTKEDFIKSYNIKNVNNISGSMFSMRNIINSVGENYNCIILAKGEKDNSRKQGKGSSVIIKNEKDIYKELEKAGFLIKMEYIIPENIKYKTSGTKIREAINNNDIDYLKKYLNEKSLEIIKNKIKYINKDIVSKYIKNSR